MTTPHTNSSRSFSLHGLKAMLVATAVSLLAQFPGTAAPPAAIAPKTVLAKPIGKPTWKFVDFQKFTAPVGTASDGYAEFFTTAVSILPTPNHDCPCLFRGPGTPHPPSLYPTEMSAGVAASGFKGGPTFRARDFSSGNGVWCTWMVIPSPGTIGSSPDFASGAIIPNSLFPIHFTGATYKNGQLLNPFLGDIDVAPLTSASCCPFDVDGQSHFPIFYADNLDFMPPGTDPVGSWEFRITATDIGGNGWHVSARFVVSHHGDNDDSDDDDADSAHGGGRGHR